jgi:hypothetical protein
MLANKLIDPTIHRPLEILKDCQGCADECPLLGGGLNRLTQHFILEGKDGV